MSAFCGSSVSVTRTSMEPEHSSSRPSSEQKSLVTTPSLLIVRKVTFWLTQDWALFGELAPQVPHHDGCHCRLVAFIRRTFSGASQRLLEVVGRQHSEDRGY